jgi:hypothetical protein
MNNEIENNNTEEPCGLVIAGATETTVPFILTKNQETNDEYLSSGDLVMIRSSNKNKLVDYTCIGTVTNITTISPYESDDPEPFNTARSLITKNEVDMGVVDVMFQDTFYKYGEVQILQVSEYPTIGEQIPISISGAMNDPFKPDTVIHKINDLEDAYPGTFPTKSFGSLINTNIPVPMIVADNKTLESARNKGIFGGTESCKSQFTGLLVDKYLSSSNLKTLIIDPKAEFSEEKLPTTRNFKRRVKKMGRDLLILKSEDIYLEKNKQITREVLKSQKLFKGSYWMTMNGEKRSLLIDVFTDICFKESEDNFTKWLNNEIQPHQLLTEVLTHIQSNYLNTIYSANNKQNDLSDCINDVLDSFEKLKEIEAELGLLKSLFMYSNEKYSVQQIARRLLLSEKSVTVIVPSKASPNEYNNFGSEEVYQLILSKIISSIRMSLDFPSDELKAIKNFNCALIVDEAQNVFPKSTENEHLKVAIKSIRKIAETYRSRGISTWLTTPSPNLIDSQLLDRILDHDIYVGSKLTRSGKKIIDDQITDKGIKDIFDRLPKPLKEYNAVGNNKMKSFHFLCKGMISPLDHDEKGLIVRIDLERDDDSDDI